MKISNETKVGALTAIAICLLVLGFNFLKGSSFFKSGNFLYARYPDAKGIMVSNPVYVNGFQVGSVYEIKNTDKNLKNINVAIKLKDNYNIPSNSVAEIIKDPLGTPSIDIHLGTTTNFLKSGDTLNTDTSPGLLNTLTGKLMPVVDQLQTTVRTMDSVLRNINTIFDPNTKHNLQSVIGNLNLTTASLAISSASIQEMLNRQSGSIAQSLNNVTSFTKNLADNNQKITKTLSNLETTTDHFASIDVDGTMAGLKSSITNLNGLISQLNSKDGSLGLLLNDKSLYNNLMNTVRSANILMDDIKTHPKRYINISVFGRKDKSNALTAPLPTDSTRH